MTMALARKTNDLPTPEPAKDRENEPLVGVAWNPPEQRPASPPSLYSHLVSANGGGENRHHHLILPCPVVASTPKTPKASTPRALRRDVGDDSRVEGMLERVAEGRAGKGGISVSLRGNRLENGKSSGLVTNG